MLLGYMENGVRPPDRELENRLVVRESVSDRISL